MVNKRQTFDMKPQFYNAYVTLSAANTYTQAVLQMPINPAATVSGGKVRVMEILKVLFDMQFDTLAEDGFVGVQLTYQSQTAILSAGDTQKYLDRYSHGTQLITSGAVMDVVPIYHDLSDGAGNGILVATPQLFLGAVSIGQSGAMSAGVKLLYRYVDIPIEEYVGIVSSQS